MKPRYSFSSRRTGQAKDPKNAIKKKQKFPEIAQKVLKDSDIIIQVLDARFIEETRNKELEEYVKSKNKFLIQAVNKSDLTSKNKIKLPYDPSVLISCKNRVGIKKIRDIIKRMASKQEKLKRTTVGVLGYPNIGKSSLINLLIGKKSAPTSNVAGFTKGLQKLKLTSNILIFDSPGVIPQDEYSTIQNKKLTKHAKIGAKTYTQVRDPEMIVSELFKEFPGALQKHYNTNTKSSEHLIEKVGRQKNFLKKGNKVNFDQTSRFILKEW